MYQHVLQHQVLLILLTESRIFMTIPSDEFIYFLFLQLFLYISILYRPLHSINKLYDNTGRSRCVLRSE